MSIIGPGGVGGVLAAVAARSGIDTEVVATPRTVDIINRRGIRLTSRQFGEIAVPMTARLRPTPGSVIIIATKSYTLPEITPGIAESQPAEVLALCNGLSHVDQVHEMPADRVTCGSISIVSERVAPGELHHHSEFTAIETEARAADWEAVSLLRQAGIRVVCRGDEWEVLWRKLRFLAPMALLTASTGQTLGPALAGAEPLIGEVAAIATASGLPTAPAEISAALSTVAPDSTSSLARDVGAGKSTELDALGHDLIRRGRRLGIGTPALERAVEAVERRMAS